MVRLARMLRLEPWVFTAAVPVDGPYPDAFALGRSDQRYRLALIRVTSEARPEPACTFLIRLPDGAARCGLGESRPMPCRTFPSELVDGNLRVGGEACTCRKWTLDDVDALEERALLEVEGVMRRRYETIVAQWNDYATGVDDANLTHRDFCSFLISAYRL
jgi:Fe-S-cluster containining protein